jgi:hypothetical protein
MNRLDRTIDDVRGAARALIADNPSGWWRSWELGELIAGKLGLAEQYRASFRGTNYDERARLKLDGQAKRAMDELAADDRLVKIGRGEQHPSGATLGGEAQYFTPARFKEAEAEAERERENRQATRERWESIYAILVTHGFEPHIVPVPNVTRSQAAGLPITLDLEGWAQLLSCLPFDAQAGEEYERK